MSKLPHDVAPTRAAKYFSLGLMMSFFVLLFGDAVQAAPRKHSAGEETWNRTTTVREEAPVCGALEKSMEKRLAEVSKLQEAIDNDRIGPPPSLIGLFKSWIGQPYTSEGQKRKQEAFQSARRRADALNDLLKSAGCAPVDIESALQKLAGKEHPPTNR